MNSINILNFRHLRQSRNVISLVQKKIVTNDHYCCKTLITQQSKVIQFFNKSYYSTQHSQQQKSLINYFKLFPKTFPNQGPPKDSFDVNLRALRKEFLSLQSEVHPDLAENNKQKHQNKKQSVVNGNDEGLTSDILNHGYNTLKSSLGRAQHILLLHEIDVVNDEQGKQNIDQAMLFEILEIHEQLENCENEDELKELKLENNKRIEDNELELKGLFEKELYNEASNVTIKLKYWYNIKNAIKEWAPGKPVNLTH